MLTQTAPRLAVMQGVCCCGREAHKKIKLHFFARCVTFELGVTLNRY